MEEEQAKLKADYVYKPQFSFLQQKIYYFDIDVEAPIYIQELEMPKQKESTKKVLEKENKELLEKISQKRKKMLETRIKE